MAKLEFVRTEGKEPCPSHGGPACSIEWKLLLNGVEIDSEHNRYQWENRKTSSLKPPSSLVSLRDAIKAGLDAGRGKDDFANIAYAAGFYQAECNLPEHPNAAAAVAEYKAMKAKLASADELDGWLPIGSIQGGETDPVLVALDSGVVFSCSVFFAKNSNAVLWRPMPNASAVIAALTKKGAKP